MSFSKRGESSLSHRLNSLANFYHQHSEVWDIGCDHGLLGLSFSQALSVKSIYLVDPSDLVVEQLHLKLKDSHIPNETLLNIIKSKGQNLKLTANSKCIFIAGMGGEEIIEIIKNLIPQMSADDRLVLSPHRKVLELRLMLSESKLGLVGELAVEENNQFYQLFALELRPELPKISPYGTDLWRSETGLRYLEKERRNFMIHQDAQSIHYVRYLEDIIARGRA